MRSRNRLSRRFRPRWSFDRQLDHRGARRQAMEIRRGGLSLRTRPFVGHGNRSAGPPRHRSRRLLGSRPGSGQSEREASRSRKSSSSTFFSTTFKRARRLDPMGIQGQANWPAMLDDELTESDTRAIAVWPARASACSTARQPWFVAGHRWALETAQPGRSLTVGADSPTAEVLVAMPSADRGQEPRRGLPEEGPSAIDQTRRRAQCHLPG
jgi:hypothetical protein